MISHPAPSLHLRSDLSVIALQPVSVLFSFEHILCTLSSIYMN